MNFIDIIDPSRNLLLPSLISPLIRHERSIFPPTLPLHRRNLHRIMSTGKDTEGAGKNLPGRCAACNYKRRRCTDECILAPHFPASDPGRYQCVHRLFGGGRVAEMLQVNSVLIKNLSDIADY
jgi:hypothetical protein